MLVIMYWLKYGFLEIMEWYYIENYNLVWVFYIFFLIIIVRVIFKDFNIDIIGGFFFILFKKNLNIMK